MNTKEETNYSKKWWYRLLSVIYVFSYFFIPFIALNNINGPNERTLIINSDGHWQRIPHSFIYYIETTLFILLIVLFSIVIIRLTKIIIIYIIKGEKPKWKKELKKLF